MVHSSISDCVETAVSSNILSLAAEAPALKRTLSNLANQACALAQAEIAIMWQNRAASHAHPAARLICQAESQYARFS